MRLTSFYLTKATRIIFAVVTVSILAVTFALPNVQAQQPRQLSLADIVIGLKSAKASLPERNKILSEAVVQRGITFALTPEIEKELAQTGAARELVDAIRLKSPIIKTSAVIESQLPKSQPKPVAAESLPDFSFYQKRADDNMGKAEYDLAIVDYNKALELNPKSVPAYFNRARAFYFKKDFSSAVESYSKAIELTPKDSVAYYNRGVSYEKTGDALKAADDYQKAVELDESNEPAKENLKKIRDAEMAKKQPLPPAPKQPEPSPIVQTNDTLPVLNYGRIDPSTAVKMVMPSYTAFARNMNAEGQVVVDVEIDEEGNVTSAKAVSGHSLLRNAAEDAARRSKFKPAMTDGKALKATGQIIYNFKR
ncbi:MAG: TonB family protein [Pyrinomonadaceae bacterium]